MIMAAPAETRDRVAFDHFFSLSQALRGIERRGKPVAASIAGLALGGGGELALATHHRVMVDDPKVALACRNLSSGCCREAEEPAAAAPDRNRKGLPILLEGARLTGRPAVAAGVIDQLVCCR